MSEIKVNKISQRSGTAITLGNSGTDFQLPSGADIVAQSGSTITIAAGATITNSGTATGFGATGAVNWNTTAVTSSPLTAVSGVGYFINTSGGAITVNLPAGVAGAIISLADYTNTWQTNNVTVTPNGSEKIGGIAASAILNVEGQSVTFIYVDATEGWKNVQDSTSNITGVSYVAATGGTILTCGNFKTHVFTGPGTFTVTCAGSAAGSNSVEYLVVAGGGGSGTDRSGGGGAGGYRQNYPSPVSAGLPVSVQGYPITVGGGGPANTGPAPGPICGSRGVSGTNSIFSTITSAGGGGSGSGADGGQPTARPGIPGGSGGGSGQGGSITGPAGTGNTPPVSPPQGNPGGIGNPPNNTAGGGGGGAGGNGSDAGGGGGVGGVGSPIATTFFGPTSPSYGTPGPAPGRYFAGGGGGGGCGVSGGAGGAGGGGGGATPGANVVGTINTGGGGGGANGTPTGVGTGKAGGSGIVVIRYKFQ